MKTHCRNYAQHSNKKKDGRNGSKEGYDNQNEDTGG